jgi:hypothetical protein
MKGYIDWAILSLLETGLWSALIILLVVHLLELCYEQRGSLLVFSGLLVLLTLTRPESFLLGGVFIVIRFVLYLYHGVGIFKAIRGVVLPVLLFGLTIAGLVAFRLQYFGYPFPNTYYAKVSVDHIYNLIEGVKYLLKFLYAYPVYLVLIIVMAISLWKAGRWLFLNRTLKNYQLAQVITALTVGLALAIPVIVGGDHFSLYRVCQPFIPVFWLLLCNVDFVKENLLTMQVHFFQKPIWNKALFFVAVLPALYLFTVPKYFVDPYKVTYQSSLLNDFSYAGSNVGISEDMNTFFNFSPKPSVGRIWAGAYAFAYDGAVIDLMGLNNTVMAHADKVKVGFKNHAAFNKKAFYQLNPEFVEGNFIFKNERFELEENKPTFDEKNFEASAMKGIFRDTAFIEKYQPVLISRDGFDRLFYTYIRRDYIPSLEQKGFAVKALERVHPPVDSFPKSRPAFPRF